MNGLHNWTGFSWKRGLFTSQLVGLYSLNALLKEKIQRSTKIQCPSVTISGNQTHWNFPTRLAVPQLANVAMAPNPAPPVLTLPAYPVTTEKDAQHCKQDYKCLTDIRFVTALTSHFKHDDGHIHHALPILGLPPEHKKPANMRSNQHADHHSTTRCEELQPSGLMEESR